MSWSHQKESTWRLPIPLPGSGRLADFLASLAGVPLLGTILAVLGLVVLAAVVLAAVVLFIVFGPISIPRPLASTSDQTTTVYAADGSPIASWHGAINRQDVSLDQISSYLPQAVVAEEDARYYSNPGVDARSVLRAAMADLKAGKVVEGGSTITQQYVKVAYVGNKPSLGRKILEARIALQLARHMSKAEIMGRYLNTVYFGDGAYGAQAAARTYFGENASALTISQAALLAGIIQSPDHDSPATNAAGAEADRVRVIARMEALGSISHAQAAAARADKPTLAAPVPDNPAFAWFLDALRTEMMQRYGAKAVYAGGLQIHTTLDPRLQAAAQASISGALGAASDPYATIVQVDPATGYVRAIVGGRNYTDEKFNIATMGRRQPGSAFKPFVLAAALEHGISPQAYFSGPSRLCLKGWTPGCVSNFGYESFGSISLTDATVNSVNTVYAQLILQVGPQAVVDVANRMGIPDAAGIVPAQLGCRPLGSDVCETYLPAVPSLALGSAAVTPLEMASAYATFAAGGVYRAPKLASQVTDASGRVLDAGPSAGVQAIPPDVAQEVTTILQQVIVRGTGKAAAIGQPAAGKTGTAQDFRNAWFVGYTPALATSVWVGYRDTNAPLLNVHGVAQMTGGTIPAEIWSQDMQVSLDASPPAATVTGGVPDRAVTNQRTPAFSGAATDDDGNVTAVQVSVDGGPWSAAGMTCTGCPARSVTWSYAPAAPLPDGVHTFAVRATDVGGGNSPAVTRTVTIDTVPPQLTGLEATGGATSLTLGFSKPVVCSSLRPAAFQVRVEGRYPGIGGVACQTTTSSSVGITLATAPRGGDRVDVTVVNPQTGPTDPAGNKVGDTRSAEATASNVAPQLAVTGGLPDGTLTSNALPSLSGSATDPDGNVTSVQASVDGAPFTAAGVSCQGCFKGATVGGPVSWSWRAPLRLADGRHTIAVEALDNATAPSPAVTRTVTIDTVPPTPAAAAATGGGAAVAVTFSKPLVCSTLASSSFQVVAGGRFLPVTGVACDGPAAASVRLTLGVPPRGGDIVDVSVASFSGGPADLAGNNVGSPRSVRATASNTAPTVSVGGSSVAGAPAVSVPDGGLTANARPSLSGSATDPDGNVTSVEASVDGAPFGGAGVGCLGCYNGAAVGAPVSWTWRAPLRLADGPHTIVVQSTDNAGATSGVVTSTLTVDTVAPKPTGLRWEGGAAGGTATFSKPLLCPTLSAGDVNATVGGRRALVTGISCSGNENAGIGITLDTPPRGGDQVVITLGAPATDQAGNHLAGRILSATATNLPPTLTLSDPATGLLTTSNARPSFLGSAADPDGAVARVEVSVDGGPFNPGGAGCTGCVGVAAGAGAAPAPVTWTWRPGTLADGPHLVVLRSVDNGGATSPEVTESVVVDTSQPALKSVLSAPGSIVVSAVFSKPIACSSVGVASFTVTVGGAAANPILATCSGATDAVVDLALSQAPAGGQEVRVSLDRPVLDDAGTRSAAPVQLTSPANLTPTDLP